MKIFLKLIEEKTVTQVLEIKHLKDKTLTFSHKEKGHHYKVLDIVKSKHPDTRKWYDAVRYKQLESKETFVRSIQSFCENFRIINNIKNKNIMNDYIKTLINVNKEANKNITALESTIQNIKVTTEKDKVNFGNLCIALKGFRMVSEATECLLMNENVLKTEDNEFYVKVDTEVKPNTNQEQQQ